MKPLDLRANGGKHQKLLLGNNATGKCLQAHMQHLFSPIPAIRWVSIFSYKNQKLVMKPLNLRANGGKTPKTTPGQQFPWQVLQAHMQHFFSPSRAIEKKFAESAFFSYKNCHETIEFTSQWGQNTKNYSWATMPLASAFTPTYNISSALAQLMRKNSLSQHFFIQKSKTMKPLNLRANGQNTKHYSQQFPWQVPSGPHATFLQP